MGTYDNGQVLYTYSTANESIEPYLKLLNEKYLINITTKGDTIYRDLHHLLEDKGYTNYNGNRFATAQGYENSMRKLMVKISMSTSIRLYQRLYNTPEDILASYFLINDGTIVEHLYAEN